MREIKFRSWEPLNKKMYEMDFCLYREHGNEKKTFALPEHSQSLRDSYCSMNLDAINIMQYTGLNDENDIQIYEGDIVKVSFWDDDLKIVSEIASIKFNGASFILRLSNDKWDYFSGAQSVKVIGNIYENPELLEVAK